MADDTSLWAFGPLAVGTLLVKIGLSGKQAYHNGLEEMAKKLWKYEVEQLPKTFDEEFSSALARGTLWINRAKKPVKVTGYNPLPDEVVEKYNLNLIHKPKKEKEVNPVEEKAVISYKWGLTTLRRKYGFDIRSFPPSFERLYYECEDNRKCQGDVRKIYRTWESGRYYPVADEMHKFLTFLDKDELQVVKKKHPDWIELANELAVIEELRKL